MADATAPLTARSILAPYEERFAALDGPVGLASAPLAQHLAVRLDPSSPQRVEVERALGVDLPGVMHAATTPVGRTVVWLGPDEWLVIDPTRSPDLADGLRTAVAGAGVVVDQSGQRVSIVVTGDTVGLLAKGTSLDLRPERFSEGSATQTLLGQAIVVVIARSADASRTELVVRWSFARSLADWLLDALRDPLAYPADHGD